MTCKTYLNKTVKKSLIYKELQDNWEKNNSIANIKEIKAQKNKYGWLIKIKISLVSPSL